MIQNQNYIFNGFQPIQSTNQSLLQHQTSSESSEYRTLNNETYFNQFLLFQTLQQNQQCQQNQFGLLQQQQQPQEYKNLTQVQNTLGFYQDNNKYLLKSNILQTNLCNTQTIKNDKGREKNQQQMLNFIQNSQITIPPINQAQQQYEQAKFNIYNNQQGNVNLLNNYFITPTFFNYGQTNSHDLQTSKMNINQFPFQISNLKSTSDESVSQQNTLNQEQNSQNTIEENKRASFQSFTTKETQQNNGNNNETIQESIELNEKQTDLIYLPSQKKIKKQKCHKCIKCIKCLNNKLPSRKANKQQFSFPHSNTKSYWFPLDQNTNEIIIPKTPDEISSNKMNNNLPSQFENQNSQIKASRFEQTRSEKWQFMKKYYNKSIINNKYIINLDNQDKNERQNS